MVYNRSSSIMAISAHISGFGTTVYSLETDRRQRMVFACFLLQHILCYIDVQWLGSHADYDEPVGNLPQ
jgi:hypothetical protein